MILALLEESNAYYFPPNVHSHTGEDHKIGEKKQNALIKDLKRQLLAEKSQNEKLSEKMAEIVIQESVSSQHTVHNEVSQNLPLANSGKIGH